MVSVLFKPFKGKSKYQYKKFLNSISFPIQKVKTANKPLHINRNSLQKISPMTSHK